jgi:single-stranded-DNA-specific exonuclease
MQPNENLPTSKRWIVSPLVPPAVKRELHDFPPFLRQLLYNRGIQTATEAHAFMDAATVSLTDPLLLRDMDVAISLIQDALSNAEKIAVYGDYDVDGVTASALLFEFFQALGNTPRVYIPNRFDEGYGLNLEAINLLAGEGVKLLITVDCGIRSVKEVALARSLGMNVILSDHHLPGHEIPPANAVINPRQPGDAYPFKHLAGVGLAYKLAAAYLQAYPQTGLKAEDWLDLVALGTVADLAELTGENRALVGQGLNVIRRSSRQGLYSLAQVSGIRLDRITTANIGFGLGPRLNAAGRLETAMAAFQLLVSDDLYESARLAQLLDDQNAQRKNLTQQIQEKAIAGALAEGGSLPIIFAASEEFSEGVVGLAASRVAERFYRPAIIGHQSDGLIVASCRSIKEFDITRALDECADLLVRYGGHSMAAGLTVANDNLPALLERLNSLASRQLAGMELTPELFIDYDIALDKLKAEHIPEIMDDVSRLEPTGVRNPEALFCSRGLRVVNPRALSDGQHLKMLLRAGINTYEGIAFRQGYWLKSLPPVVDVAYTFEINEYQGRQSLQLNIRDIRPAENPA